MIKRNEENIKPLIEYKNKKNENLIINNLESIIIKENEEYNKRLKKWICPYKNIKMKGKLLYRLSKDGKEYETFHKKCDNRGETLILIKINENLIIGGYTSLNWDSSSKWKKDNNTFIFSLTHNKKYIKNNDNSNSIYCLNSFGPMFDNLGFDENKSMKEFKFNPQNSFLYSYEIFPDNKNEIFCEVKEVEIYSLMIENNYIISQYNIKSDKKEQSEKIINSCFGEINELSCDLYLNNKKINFDLDYLFSEKGEHTFKIIFKILLKDISGMFYYCSSLTSLNLSNFNTNNFQDMNNMFYYCSSLTSFHL
jgi:surface protein